MLTQEQLSQYKDDGFLLVTEPLLPGEEVTFVEERVDRLYERWNALPRRMAPGPSDGATPPIARVHWLKAFDPVLAHSQLVETCRGLAAAILGSNQVWCRFDAAVYKHPGAGEVEWHEDSALSVFGTPKRSVHFWVPLNDHAGNAGTLKFVPGSHRHVLSKDRVGTHSSASHPADVSEDVTPVGVPLSVGNFSIHTPWTTHGSDPNLSGQTRKALVLEFSTGVLSAAREVGVSLMSRFLSRR
jgi:ectoine hydroxylase-related dioxygenase (phytanoyl-CoA dioxygenase family)